MKKVLFNSGNGKVKVFWIMDFIFMFHTEITSPFGDHSIHYNRSYKLIKFHDNDELNLFDLSSDIGELNNLAEDFQKKKKKKTRIQKWRTTLRSTKTVKWGKGIDWKFKSIQEINSFTKFSFS